jgi:Aminoglycoside/hydroxyurea antibiotic resistance kinase
LATLLHGREEDAKSKIARALELGSEIMTPAKTSARIAIPWLAIDPKPHIGDPTYDPLQHMLNCDERLHADPRALAARIADLLGLDRERLTLWLFARCMQESLDWPQLADVARRLAPE